MIMAMMMIALTIFQWILSTLIYLILLFINISLFFYFWNGPLPVNKNNPNLVILKGYPFLGSLWDFFPSRIFKTIEDYPVEYGKNVHYSGLFNKFGYFLISDAESCKEILTRRPKSFTRVRALNFTRDLLELGSALHALSGTEWSRIRKAVTPSYNELNIKKKLPVLLTEMNSWIETIRTTYGDTNTGKLAVDMKAEAVRLTTRIITIMAFGFDLQSLANNKEEQELCAYFLSPEFLHDMRLIFNLGYIVGTFPLPRTFFWPLIHGRTEQLTRDANQRFTGHILKLIEFKKKSYQKQQSQTLSSNSMMDSLLNKEGVQLTNDELIANAKAFYMGGLETTSTALMWTMYYLSLHPDIQEKCYEEVKEKFFPLLTGTNPVADEGNYWFETISRLFYCQAIVKEGLRIAPPASFTSLQTENEETITLANGITFTGNDLIFVNNEGVHRSTDYYGPKAREFIPERWLTNDSKEKQRLEEYFFPFGGGPRHCPGNNLALHELILAIAYLCYHFKFSLNCPREEIIRMKSITSTANKMPLLFIPRDHSK